MDQIPRIKKAVLTQKFNIAVDEQTHLDYVTLKTDHGIDVAECIRRAIRIELDRLKSLVSGDRA